MSSSPGGEDELWSRFVASGVAASARLVDTLGSIPLDRLDDQEAGAALRRAVTVAISIASQSLLHGAEPAGRLALAIERVLDEVAAGQLHGEIALPYLMSASHTLAQAFGALAHPDRSGARMESLPLEGARYELETLLPVPGRAAAASAAAGTPDVPLARLARSATSSPHGHSKPRRRPPW